MFTPTDKISNFDLTEKDSVSSSGSDSDNSDISDSSDKENSSAYGTSNGNNTAKFQLKLSGKNLQSLDFLSKFIREHPDMEQIEGIDITKNKITDV